MEKEYAKLTHYNEASYFIDSIVPQAITYTWRGEESMGNLPPDVVLSCKIQSPFDIFMKIYSTDSEEVSLQLKQKDFFKNTGLPKHLVGCLFPKNTSEELSPFLFLQFVEEDKPELIFKPYLNYLLIADGGIISFRGNKISDGYVLNSIDNPRENQFSTDTGWQKFGERAIRIEENQMDHNRIRVYLTSGKLINLNEIGINDLSISMLFLNMINNGETRSRFINSLKDNPQLERFTEEIIERIKTIGKTSPSIIVELSLPKVEEMELIRIADFFTTREVLRGLDLKVRLADSQEEKILSSILQ